MKFNLPLFALRKTIPKAQFVILGSITLLCVVGWYLHLSYKQHVENPYDTTIPSLTQMKDGLIKAAMVDEDKGYRWIVADFIATTTTLTISMSVAVTLGILLGVLMGSFGYFEALFFPTLSIAKQIMPFVMMAVFFVTVNLGIQLYTAIVCFGAVPILALTVALTIKDVPKELEYKALTLGASTAEVITNVFVPLALPKVIDTVRLLTGQALGYIIVAEMLVGTVGLGYRIRLQQKVLEMGVVYPYILLMALFTFVLVDLLLKNAELWLCKWNRERR